MAVVRKPYKRRERVGPQIHRELNELLARGVGDVMFMDASVTIGLVDVSPDFAQAKVYFSVLDSGNAPVLCDHLNKISGLFQREVAAGLALRRMPKLIFVYDTSIEAANRIDALLDDVS